MSSTFDTSVIGLLMALFRGLIFVQYLISSGLFYFGAITGFVAHVVGTFYGTSSMMPKL